jgi:aspartate racemase
VLRTDLSADPTFVTLLRRVRETALDAYAHQDLPFEKLVEELTPERHVGASPVVQVMFAYQNFPAAPFELPGCSTEPIELDSETAKFPLTLLISPAADGMRCVMSYDTGLFRSETASRMLAHFRNLLEEIVADPDRRISQLQIFDEGERRQLLLDWNDNMRPYPRDKCIHQLFEAQVAATPDAVAVSVSGQRLTYRELNARANRLAHVLRRLRVAPEEMVGICSGRSVEMIVAVLAVLKAGCAYLPLDPTYPRERLAFIVSDARCRLVLSESRFAQVLRVAVSGQGEVVCLDHECQTGDQESEATPSTEVWPESLAYVMYTSGSTGAPKGVAVTHRNVIRLVKSQNYGKFAEGDVFLQFAPLTFDASTFEIWGSLLNGAELVIAPADALSPEQLGAEIERSGVTTLWLTAALFHLMVDQCLGSLRGVKQLLAGGDVLSARHVMRVVKELPNCRLINGYGPTENTTFSCCYPIVCAEHLEDSVPIGRPINRTQAYVLDADLSLVPRGIAGELYVSGDGLARGYCNKPELTAERFIPHPFALEAGARLYRTGDRVRYLPDGNIQFLGRLDHQVKIRGYRIEPGEIEGVLGHCPGIREAVVVARQNARGEKILVAYVDSPAKVEIGTLRSFLKERLPDYMIPAAFVHLETLPLTFNGKVDRKALPSPDAARPDLITPFVLPRTPTEEALARIWSELLHIDGIGVHDNFFELGGHSLLATQVASRVRADFKIDLALRAFFEQPTLGGLAECVENAMWVRQCRETQNDVSGSEEMDL